MPERSSRRMTCASSSSFNARPGILQRGSRRTAKSKSACSGGSYQSRSKPTSQFTFTDPAFTGGGSSLNRAIIICRQSIVHVTEAFDVFGRDQARSIAAGVRSNLPFRGQIFPQRLAYHLKLNRFDEFAVGFTKFVAFCYANLRKFRHQFVGCVRVEGKAPVLERFHHRVTGRSCRAIAPGACVAAIFPAATRRMAPTARCTPRA